jgi:trans-aconitate methyltransferase
MSEDQLDGSFYHNHSSMQEKLAMDSLQLYQFKGNERVLDIGCGDGKISATIAKQLPKGKIIGIDPSRPMIEFAKEEYKKISNLKFQLSPGETFRNREIFDLIVSFSTLHWVKNQSALFENILSLLKKNGTLMVVGAIQTESPLSIAFQDAYACPSWNFLKPELFNFHAKPLEFYQDLLGKMSFQHPQVEAFKPMITFEHTDDLAEWVKAWVPLATGLQNEQALQLSQYIAKNIGDQGFLNSDKTVIFPFPIVKITAGPGV